MKKIWYSEGLLVRRRIRIGLVLTGLLILLTFGIVVCAADTYTVCSSGCDYVSIQAAIDNATAGDTIEVHSGTYYENVNMDRQLILRGIDTGIGKPAVDARGSGSAITLNANGITVDGFTAINASNIVPAVGILIYSNNSIVINNTASNNTNGILMSSSSNNNLTDNTVSNNDYGITLGYSNNNNLTGNTASGNINFNIYLASSNNNTLTDNTASGGTYNAIYLFSSSDNNLTGNNASNNANYGIELIFSSNNTLMGNIALNNTNYGIHLHYSSDNIIYNNYFNNTNNAYDDGTNIWNITQTQGTNIIDGPNLGGNYWSDYEGVDTDTLPDGLGDTLLPYNSSGEIINGGDYHPLVLPPVTPNAVIEDAELAIDTINGLNPGLFKNPNNKKALTNKLNAVIQMVEQGEFDGALDKLQNDILQKMDGCAETGTGAPDKNDWIMDCDAQQEVYAIITELIELLEELI